MSEGQAFSLGLKLFTTWPYDLHLGDVTLQRKGCSPHLKDREKRLRKNLSLIGAAMKTASEKLHASSSSEIVDLTGEDEFHFFPRLPAEIRVAIWKQFILDNPRMVQLNFRKSSSSIGKEHSPTSPPTLLRVNREARYEALKVHTLMELTDGNFYINLEIDTAYIFAIRGYVGDAFPPLRLLGMHPSFRSTLRHVAFEVSAPGHTWAWAYYLQNMLKHFEAIQDVTLVGPVGPGLDVICLLNRIWSSFEDKISKVENYDGLGLIERKVAIFKPVVAVRPEPWMVENVRTYKGVDG